MSKRSAVYADDLETAGPRDLLSIDQRGNVVPAPRRRIMAGARYGLLLILLALEAVAGYQVWGAPGLAVAAVLGALVAWRLQLEAQLRRGVGALAEQRVDEATDTFERLRARKVLPVGWRARAIDGLSRCAYERGDVELALELTREADRRRRPRSRNVHAMWTRYREVMCLVRLGRVAEARSRLEALGPAPTEGVLRVASSVAELFVAFGEGSHAFDDGALHERATLALGITSSAPWLALLAWAFDRSGDGEMARLLADEAMDRPNEHLERAMPEVKAWLDAFVERGSAERARVEVDADEPVEAQLGERSARRRELR